MNVPARATLHLRILGEVRKVPVEVPPTPAAAIDLLPAARAITQVAMEVAIERSTAAGAPASCRRGCDACCHQLVAVNPPEARALADIVDQMPADRQHTIRQRFAETTRIARDSGILDRDCTDASPTLLLRPDIGAADPYIELAQRYHRLNQPCGFLEEGACSIYEHRPLVCREYVVSSPPEHCGTLAFASIDMIRAPLRLSDGLSDIAAAIEMRPAVQIPLFAALAWAAATKPPERNVSGVDLLKLLGKWVDSKSAVPLEQRAGN